ncbi:hypothetical protein RRG08_013456 [Elysia crispata]|uniref:Uncharacterized protein n=1 Tax=Elysia crispata TaxID=231223 RepID=A0AAE1EB70_9GAST|nr:hypothetical protein RRG08_013456 [Elysia crispata]
MAKLFRKIQTIVAPVSSLLTSPIQTDDDVSCFTSSIPARIFQLPFNPLSIPRRASPCAPLVTVKEGRGREGFSFCSSRGRRACQITRRLKNRGKYAKTLQQWSRSI